MKEEEDSITFGYIPKESLLKNLGICRKTLEEWIKLGLPFVKINRLVFFKMEDIEKFMSFYRKEPHKPRTLSDLKK
jgi:predicted site-specific integrase-resolvase